MKKRLLWILGITVAILLVVIIAFVIKTSSSKKQAQTPAINGQPDNTETQVDPGNTGASQEIKAIDVYKGILIEEQYKKDGAYGFDSDCHFLLWDADQDGELELIVTGPTGLDSLYASIMYDYEGHVLSFADAHGDLVMVTNGALAFDGWVTEGEEDATECYQVSKGAEMKSAPELAADSSVVWSLTLYADYDYEGLDLEGVSVVYMYPVEAESIDAHCVD